MAIRRIALLSISIALVACSGCATFRHPEEPERPEAKDYGLPEPRFDLSRALHGISDWAER